jgi:hypothetical protein
MKKMSRTSFGDVLALSSCPSLEGSFIEDDAEISNSFLDKYDLLEKLGEGGNACVFKCQFKKT